MRSKQNYEAMMKRLHANMSSDEMYLIAMAFVCLQTRFKENPERMMDSFGTAGKEVFDLLLNDEP
jgi:hypothetical protein